MKKLIILTSLITSFAYAKIDTKTDTVPKKPEQAPQVVTVATAANEMKVGVKGMVCAFCAQGIEKNFKGQKEVSKIEVSLENKFVKLTFKEGQTLSKEKISELLKEAGYEAFFE